MRLPPRTATLRGRAAHRDDSRGAGRASAPRAPSERRPGSTVAISSSAAAEALIAPGAQPPARQRLRRRRAARSQSASISTAARSRRPGRQPGEQRLGDEPERAVAVFADAPAISPPAGSVSSNSTRQAARSASTKAKNARRPVAQRLAGSGASRDRLRRPPRASRRPRAPCTRCTGAPCCRSTCRAAAWSRRRAGDVVHRHRADSRARRTAGRRCRGSGARARRAEACVLGPA